jgi:hypothetical protein
VNEYFVTSDIMPKLVYCVNKCYELFFSDTVINFNMCEVLTNKVDGIMGVVFFLP